MIDQLCVHRTEWGPEAKGVSVEGPLAMDDSEVTNSIRTKSSRVWSHVWTHTTMDDDHGVQQRRIFKRVEL